MTAPQPAGEVGRPTARVDGLAKVTGGARYAADHPAPGLLHGVLVTAATVRAARAAPDVTAARAAPGVVDVITDFSGARLPFPTEAVGFYGQPVAVVVADTLERAEHAVSLVDTGPVGGSGGSDGGPAPVAFMDAAGATVTPSRQSPDDDRGDAPAELARSPVRVDATYRIARENHNPMELPATLAQWDGDRLTVHDKTQWVQGAARSLATALGVPTDHVRVLSPFVGGAFGNAGSVWPHQILAALTARRLGRPVKLVVGRRAMYSGVGYRPASEQRLALGAGPDGRLTAIVHEARTEVSRYARYEDREITRNPKFLYASPAMRSRYRLAEIDTHQPTFMRGPGAVTGSFALETAMDELAAALVIDPIELRRRNEPALDQADGLPFSTRGLLACYDRGAAEFGWAGRDPRPRTRREGGKLIGTGMAAAAYGTTAGRAEADARIHADGTALVTTATSDMGPGTYTSMTQVAADALGLPLERVRFELGDSDFPTAPGHFGSQTMASVGPAVLTACSMLRDGMVRAAVVDPLSPLHGARPDQVVVSGGVLSVAGDAARSEPYERILARRGRTSMDTRRDWEQPPEAERVSTSAYGAVFAEVAVDEALGEIRVRRMRAAYDAGRIVNPRLAHSQAIGAMVGGIGMALLESTDRDHRDGRILNANLSDYLVPTNADVVDLDAVFLGDGDPATGPLEVKGLGEIVIVGVPAAIGNAVYHATGRRVRDLPIALETQL